MNQLFSIVFILPIILFVIPIGFVLRSEIVFWSVLLTSLLFPWIAYEIVQNDLGKYDLYWFVVSVSPTTLMCLYKLFDWVILKLYKRHFFITWKGNYLPLKEGWLDLIMQFVLIFSTQIWFWVGKAIFG